MGNGADDPVHHVRQIPEFRVVALPEFARKALGEVDCQIGPAGGQEGLAGGYCQADGLRGVFGSELPLQVRLHVRNGLPLLPGIGLRSHRARFASTMYSAAWHASDERSFSSAKIRSAAA